MTKIKTTLPVESALDPLRETLARLGELGGTISGNTFHIYLKPADRAWPMRRNRWRFPTVILRGKVIQEDGDVFIVVRMAPSLYFLLSVPLTVGFCFIFTKLINRPEVSLGVFLFLLALTILSTLVHVAFESRQACDILKNIYTPSLSPITNV